MDWMDRYLMALDEEYRQKLHYLAVKSVDERKPPPKVPPESSKRFHGPTTKQFGGMTVIDYSR